MDNNLIYVFLYGSVVYGTQNQNSDIDVIYVVKEKNKTDKNLINKLVIDKLGLKEFRTIDIHEYSEEEFLTALEDLEISFLECISLSEDKIVYQNKPLPCPIINKEILRESISKKSSNSWVKAKKKLIIPEDYNLNVAQKSLFHSLRIIDFGIQLAKMGKIIDFSSSNHLLDEIKQLDNKWEVWEKQYKQLFNEKSSEFKQLAPKKLKL